MSMAMKYAMKKRMAKGGQVGDKTPGEVYNPKTGKREVSHDPNDELTTIVEAEPQRPGEKLPPRKMAQGGECMACRGGTCMAHGGDVVERIMKRMSEGGMIANGGETERADGEPAQFDDLALRDDLESSYTGANSGDMDEAPAADMDDDDDIVSRIMKRTRQTMPRTGQPGYPE